MPGAYDYSDLSQCILCATDYRTEKLSFLAKKQDKRRASELAEVSSATRPLTPVLAQMSFPETARIIVANKRSEKKLRNKYTNEYNRIAAERCQVTPTSDLPTWCAETGRMIHEIYQQTIRQLEFQIAVVRGHAKYVGKTDRLIECLNECTVNGNIDHAMVMAKLQDGEEFSDIVEPGFDKLLSETASRVIASIFHTMQESYTKFPTDFNWSEQTLERAQARYQNGFKDTVDRLGGMCRDNGKEQTYYLWSAAGMHRADQAHANNPDRVTTFQSLPAGICYNIVVSKIVNVGLLSWISTSVLFIYGSLSYALASEVISVAKLAEQQGKTVNLMIAMPTVNMDNIFSHVEWEMLQQSGLHNLNTKFYSLPKESGEQYLQVQKLIGELSEKQSVAQHMRKGYKISQSWVDTQIHKLKMAINLQPFNYQKTMMPFKLMSAKLDQLKGHLLAFKEIRVKYDEVRALLSEISEYIDSSYFKRNRQYPNGIESELQTLGVRLIELKTLIRTTNLTIDESLQAQKSILTNIENNVQWVECGRPDVATGNRKHSVVSNGIVDRMRLRAQVARTNLRSLSGEVCWGAVSDQPMPIEYQRALQATPPRSHSGSPYSARGGSPLVLPRMINVPLQQNKSSLLNSPPSSPEPM